VNRRNFLGGVLGGSVLATAAASDAAPDPVEPMPRDFSFKPIYECGMDVCTMGVMQALSNLGWETDAPPRPLLVVSPADYPLAIEANRHLGDLCRVVASQRLERYAWFVAWRGQKLGSGGA
jgi:hypothetical protein